MLFCKKNKNRRNDWESTQNKDTCTLRAGILLFILASTAIIVNFTLYRYPGNLYVPTISLFLGLVLLLSWTGTRLLFGYQSLAAQMLKEALYYTIVIVLLGYATTAIQFTPFSPIDQLIVKFESIFHIELTKIMALIEHYPKVRKLLVIAYNYIQVELVFFPLLIIASQQYDKIHWFYFSLIVSALIGFTFYYFFPTTAPASVLESPLFIDVQRTTFLKFYQVHNGIPPTSIAGGMIALPSFHVIWLFYCQQLISKFRIAYFLTLPINILMMLSCVLLGWHYITDIVGSMIVILLTHFIYTLCKKRTRCFERPKTPLYSTIN